MSSTVLSEPTTISWVTIFINSPHHGISRAGHEIRESFKELKLQMEGLSAKTVLVKVVALSKILSNMDSNIMSVLVNRYIMFSVKKILRMFL